MIRRWLCALGAFLILTAGSVAAASPASRMASVPASLNGVYPCVGCDDHSLYYLDPSSCYIVTDGNTATLGALIYGATRSANDDGTPEEIVPYTVTYKTWTEGGERIIHVDSIFLADGTRMEAWPDSAEFFYELFWKVAGNTWARGSL